MFFVPCLFVVNGLQAEQSNPAHMVLFPIDDSRQKTALMNYRNSDRELRTTLGYCNQWGLKLFEEYERMYALLFKIKATERTKSNLERITVFREKTKGRSVDQYTLEDTFDILTLSIILADTIRTHDYKILGDYNRYAFEEVRNMPMVTSRRDGTSSQWYKAAWTAWLMISTTEGLHANIEESLTAVNSYFVDKRWDECIKVYTSINALELKVSNQTNQSLLFLKNKGISPRIQDAEIKAINRQLIPAFTNLISEAKTIHGQRIQALLFRQSDFKQFVSLSESKIKDKLDLVELLMAISSDPRRFALTEIRTFEKLPLMKEELISYYMSLPILAWTQPETPPTILPDTPIGCKQLEKTWASMAFLMEKTLGQYGLMGAVDNKLINKAESLNLISQDRRDSLNRSKYCYDELSLFNVKIKTQIRAIVDHRLKLEEAETNHALRLYYGLDEPFRPEEGLQLIRQQAESGNALAQEHLPLLIEGQTFISKFRKSGKEIPIIDRLMLSATGKFASQLKEVGGGRYKISEGTEGDAIFQHFIATLGEDKTTKYFADLVLLHTLLQGLDGSSTKQAIAKLNSMIGKYIILPGDVFKIVADRDYPREGSTRFSMFGSERLVGDTYSPVTFHCYSKTKVPPYAIAPALVQIKGFTTGVNKGGKAIIIPEVQIQAIYSYLPGRANDGAAEFIINY